MYFIYMQSSLCLLTKLIELDVKNNSLTSLPGLIINLYELSDSAHYVQCSRWSWRSEEITNTKSDQ